MLANAARGVSVDAAAYAFELKWDGCRAHVRVIDGELTIWNRRGQERTALYEVSRRVKSGEG
jgi:ATP-dependent DNA ligase